MKIELIVGGRIAVVSSIETLLGGESWEDRLLVWIDILDNDRNTIVKFGVKMELKRSYNKETFLRKLTKKAEKEGASALKDYQKRRRGEIAREFRIQNLQADIPVIEEMFAIEK